VFHLSRRVVVAFLLSLALTAPASFAQSKTAKDSPWAITILKKDVTQTARFYPYAMDGIAMEVLAVRASDGTIRTALNTCQVCYDSGRGFYKQSGSFLVCQNCGNRFHIDQIERIKGGCNPVPITAELKTDLGDSIGISRELMASAKDFFRFWKKRA
jgi:uncharacterized membrane protein